MIKPPWLSFYTLRRHTAASDLGLCVDINQARPHADRRGGGKIVPRQTADINTRRSPICLPLIITIHQCDTTQ